jgi:hypothetical protein
MGGLWSDALGEKGDARLTGIEHRCDEFLTATVEPQESYYPLRAVDAGTVQRLSSTIQRTALQDPAEAPHASELTALFGAIADAARETIDARRAADVVKEDVTQQPQPPIRRLDKEAAAEKLAADRALHALLQAGPGPYADEARTAGLLFAIDRMEIASGLPKHLKIAALKTEFVDLFGIPPPSLPPGGAAPIPSGTWLLYLTDVATAAGHPLPADARDPQNREPLAWNGVLEGLADRVRAEAPRLPAGSTLSTVARAVVERLDDGYRNERIVYEARAPQFR